MNLQTNKDNPRTITADAYDKLKRSIERNPDGLTANKIAHKDGIIISGNQRYRAIQELKLDMKPEWFKDLSGWTQEQIDEWVIQSNISAGEWDWDILANEWEADNLIDWGIDMPDDWGTSKELPEDIDEIPEVKTPISKLGDLWLLGSHRVLCGDSTDKSTVERLMDGKKADMVFTDPPYGVNYKYNDYEDIQGDKYQMFCDLWFETISIFCNKIIITPGAVNLPEWISRSRPKHIGVWTKTNAMTHGTVTHFWATEPILFYGDFTKKRANDVFNFPVSKQKDVGDHTCPKPMEMMIDIVENFSEKNETILDVFLGSGSTLIACEQTDRLCYGLELDPHYVDVICKRWQTLTGELPILESTGEAHDFMVQSNYENYRPSSKSYRQRWIWR